MHIFGSILDKRMGSDYVKYHSPNYCLHESRKSPYFRDKLNMCNIFLEKRFYIHNILPDKAKF